MFFTVALMRTQMIESGFGVGIGSGLIGGGSAVERRSEELRAIATVSLGSAFHHREKTKGLGRPF